MSDFNMIPVESSSIAAIGYERETQTMRVEFTSRAAYDFAGVPEEVYEKFLRSESKGSFFQINVRSNYEFVCIKPRAPKKEVSHGDESKAEDPKAKVKTAVKSAVKARAERNRIS